MNLFKSLAVVAGLFVVPTIGLSATLTPGVYDVSDYDGKRSIWTPGGSDTLVSGNGASRLWSFSHAKLSYDGASASMTAKATNLTDSSLMFDVSLSFAVNTTPQPGYCQFNGVDKGCKKGPYAGVDPASWTYFDFLSGSMTGSAGSAIETVAYNITDNPMHRAQAGLGANALEAGDDGFSMWFRYNLVSGQSTLDGYHFAQKGTGDINVDIAPVPLPATGLLLLAAVGGLAMGRRRKIAA